MSLEPQLCILAKTLKNKISGAPNPDLEKLYKQKLLDTPNTVGVGHFFGCQIQIWRYLGPVCFWSCGASLSRKVYNTIVVL